MADKPAMHGRDHHPTLGSDPIIGIEPTTGEIPWARAYAVGADAGGTDQAIASSTLTRISTTDAINSYTSTFSVTTGASTRIEVLVKGYYVIRTAAVMNSLSNGEKIKFHIGGAGNIPGSYVEFRSHSGVDDVGFLWLAMLAPNSGVEPWVFHVTGASENIGSRFVEVAYLGTFTPSVPSGGGIFA